MAAADVGDAGATLEALDDAVERGQPRFTTDDYIAVQALVTAGLGVSVIPGLAVVHALPGLEVRALGADAPVRRISAARPRDGYHGPAVTAMLESLGAAAQTLV